MIRGNYRRIVVDSSVIEVLLKRKTFEDIELLDTLPEDAMLVLVQFGIQTFETTFFFESSEFSAIEVESWSLVPSLTPSARRKPREGVKNGDTN